MKDHRRTGMWLGVCAWLLLGPGAGVTFGVTAVSPPTDDAARNKGSTVSEEDLQTAPSLGPDRERLPPEAAAPGQVRGAAQRG
jgi:hypothetical protein